MRRRSRRRGRSRQRLLHELHAPGAAVRRARAGGRGALAHARAQASRRRRPRGPAQRRQVVAAGGAHPGPPQDRRVPVHHPRAQPRRAAPRRGHRGASPTSPGSSREPARAPVSGTASWRTSSARRCSCTCSTAATGPKRGRRRCAPCAPNCGAFQRRSCWSARRSCSSTRPTCSTTPAGSRPARSSPASAGRPRRSLVSRATAARARETLVAASTSAMAALARSGAAAAATERARRPCCGRATDGRCLHGRARGRLLRGPRRPASSACSPRPTWTTRTPSRYLQQVDRARRPQRCPASRRRACPATRSWSASRSSSSPEGGRCVTRRRGPLCYNRRREDHRRQSRFQHGRRRSAAPAPARARRACRRRRRAGARRASRGPRLQRRHRLRAARARRAASARAGAGLQAASAVGQGRLFAHYERLFARPRARRRAGPAHQRRLRAPRRATSTRATRCAACSRWGIVPVINENDTTATDEIRFGDNDVLAAQVAIMLRADLLVLLTDQDGLYTSDPRVDAQARLVERVERPARARRRSTSACSRRGAGGMSGKVAAALMAAAADVRTVIANGSRPGRARRRRRRRGRGHAGRAARRPACLAFKLWLRYAKPVRGTLEVDAGAARALAAGGGSLLPVGVVAVHGGFAAGDAVAIVGPGRRRGRARALHDERARPAARARAAQRRGARRQPAPRRRSRAPGPPGARRRGGRVTVEQTCAAAQRASRALARLPRARKDEALAAVAEAARAPRRRDPARERGGPAPGARGPPAPMRSSTGCCSTRTACATSPRACATLAALPDPVGQIASGWRLANGLELRKVRVPLGVVAVVYEARPNVTVDAACLCLKTGNAVILRGGSAAKHSNRILAEVVQGAVIEAGLPREAVSYLVAGPRRARPSCSSSALRRPRHPARRRGAQGLPARAQQGAGHLRGRRQLPRVRRRRRRPRQGRAHHRQREVPAARACATPPRPCSCTGTWRRDFLPRAVAELAAARRRAGRRQGGRGHRRRPGAQARQQDALRRPSSSLSRWRCAWSSSLDEALDHIATYGTRHSEAIVTEDLAAARRFTAEVDAACVYVNASTRFTDGGAVRPRAPRWASPRRSSTSAGPIALQELTCVKYELWGDGQVPRVAPWRRHVRPRSACSAGASTRRTSGTWSSPRRRVASLGLERRAVRARRRAASQGRRRPLGGVDASRDDGVWPSRATPASRSRASRSSWVCVYTLDTWRRRARGTPTTTSCSSWAPTRCCSSTPGRTRDGILALCTLAVAPRPGDDREVDAAAARHAGARAGHRCSTRRCWTSRRATCGTAWPRGLPIRYLVPDAVEAFIREHRLYGDRDRPGRRQSARGGAPAPRRRLAHCHRVAAEAADLARRCGASPAKAELAGLLHDYCRELTARRSSRRRARHGIAFGSVEARRPKSDLLHGPVAAAELAAIGPHRRRSAGHRPAHRRRRRHDRAREVRVPGRFLRAGPRASPASRGGAGAGARRLSTKPLRPRPGTACSTSSAGARGGAGGPGAVQRESCRRR